MAENGVLFKATVNGLVVVLKDDEDFATVMESVEKKLDSSGRFFKGASLDVKYRGRKLSRDEEKKIVELMTKKTGAEIKSFEEDVQDPSEAVVPQAPAAKMQMKKHMYFKGIDEGITKFYRGTVRSGQLVHSDGNLVVIGDVNPGGEVVAAGNVVVIGALRGIVHAGSDGNKEALVVALSLNPTQLRIADVITRSPDEIGTKGLPIPEMAFVKDDMVYIERFLPQSKGVGTGAYLGD